MKNILYTKRFFNYLKFSDISIQICNLLIDNPDARIINLTINFIKEDKLLDFYYNFNFNVDFLANYKNIINKNTEMEDEYKIIRLNYFLCSEITKSFFNDQHVPHNLFIKGILKDPDIENKYSQLKSIEEIKNFYREYKFLITLQYKNYEKR